MQSINHCLNKLKIQVKGMPWGGSKTCKRKRQRKTKGKYKSKAYKSKRIKKKTRKYR